MAATTISPKHLDNLLERYSDKGGYILQTDEGVLTSGSFLLYADPENLLKFIVIKEVYVNEWSSVQTIRKYNVIPKKYLKILEEAEGFKLPDNWFSLSLIRSKSKNFTSAKGKLTHKTAGELMTEIRSNKRFEYSKQVQQFLKQNSNIINL